MDHVSCDGLPWAPPQGPDPEWRQAAMRVLKNWPPIKDFAYWSGAMDFFMLLENEMRKTPKLPQDK